MKRVFVFILLIILWICSNYANAFMPKCVDKTYLPKQLEQLFPGAEMPIYVCSHDVNGDDYADIVLVYAWNEDNQSMVIIKALMFHEYNHLLEMEEQKRIEQKK